MNIKKNFSQGLHQTHLVSSNDVTSILFPHLFDNYRNASNATDVTDALYEFINGTSKEYNTANLIFNNMQSFYIALRRCLNITATGNSICSQYLKISPNSGRKRRSASKRAITRNHQAYQKYNYQSVLSEPKRVQSLMKRRRYRNSGKVHLNRLRPAFPAMLNCFGSTLGCLFCYVFLFYQQVSIDPGACQGACGVAVGGACGTVAGMGIEKITQQTVICSELYRQGFMSYESYLADARFGMKLKASHPKVVDVYRALATPVVLLMRKSKMFTKYVNAISKPWREHMEFVEGVRPHDNEVGKTIMKIIIPLFTLLGNISEILKHSFICIVLLSSLYIWKRKYCLII